MNVGSSHWVTSAHGKFSLDGVILGRTVIITSDAPESIGLMTTVPSNTRPAVPAWQDENAMLQPPKNGSPSVIVTLGSGMKLVA